MSLTLPNPYHTLEYYKTKHKCTCEGGPEHSCMYPEECYEYAMSSCGVYGRCVKGPPNIGCQGNMGSCPKYKGN